MILMRFRGWTIDQWAKALGRYQRVMKEPVSLDHTGAVKVYYWWMTTYREPPVDSELIGIQDAPDYAAAHSMFDAVDAQLLKTA